MFINLMQERDPGQCNQLFSAFVFVVKKQTRFYANKEKNTKTEHTRIYMVRHMGVKNKAIELPWSFPLTSLGLGDFNLKP